MHSSLTTLEKKDSGISISHPSLFFEIWENFQLSATPLLIALTLAFYFVLILEAFTSSSQEAFHSLRTD